MFKKSQYLTILLGFLLILVIVSIIFILERQAKSKHDKIRVGIAIDTDEQRGTLKKYFPGNPKIDDAKYIEVTTGWKEFFLFQREGLEPELVFEVDKQKLIDTRFHTLRQIDSVLIHFQDQYNQVVKVDTIGESSFNKLPIHAIKISDFPRQEQDEPSVLFTASHHANEPLGVEICLYLIEYLCNNYTTDTRVKQWVDSSEIWLVPVINPDGYQLTMDSESKLIWRKNLRDNNNDGKFSPETDGVDLNRNYDYNWGIEGEKLPNSNCYPGSFPFSEPETQAIRDLAIREHFVCHLDFHSAGQVILYPYSNPQDERVIATAKEIARNINKRNGSGCFSILPMNDKVGQCSLWMYNKLGVLSLIVEAGDSYFPAADEMNSIIKENAKAALWMLDFLLSKWHSAAKLHTKIKKI